MKYIVTNTEDVDNSKKLLKGFPESFLSQIETIELHGASNYFEIIITKHTIPKLLVPEGYNDMKINKSTGEVKIDYGYGIIKYNPLSKTEVLDITQIKNHFKDE